jgi:hypothetical protein
MRVVIVIDFDRERGCANARAFLGAEGLSLVEVKGRRRSVWVPEYLEGAQEVVVTLGHKSHSTGKQVDVFYSTDFKPEVVKYGEVWIWRSVTEDAPLTTAEANQILEWAICRGKDSKVLPRCLRRGRGQPTLAAMAVLCQAALAARPGLERLEPTSREWWRTTLGQTKDELLSQLELEWGARAPGDTGRGIVRTFVEQLFDVDRASLLESDIDTFFEAVRGELFER